MKKTIWEYEKSDGETGEILVRPSHIIEFEGTEGLEDESVEAAYKLAHLASGSALDFDVWLKQFDALALKGELDDGGDGGPAPKTRSRKR